MKSAKSQSLLSTSRPSHSRGFTLLEVIIALSVVAVGILAVSRAMTGYIENSAALEQRMVATWVASNRLESLRIQKTIPEPGTSYGSEDMAGRTWHFSETVSTTADPLLYRIDLVVFSDQQREIKVGSVTGYLLNTEAISTQQEITSQSRNKQPLSTMTWSFRRTTAWMQEVERRRMPEPRPESKSYNGTFHLDSGFPLRFVWNDSLLYSSIVLQDHET